MTFNPHKAFHQMVQIRALLPYYKSRHLSKKLKDGSLKLIKEVLFMQCLTFKNVHKPFYVLLFFF